MRNMIQKRNIAALMAGAVCGVLYLVARAQQPATTRFVPLPILTLAQAQAQFPQRILVPRVLPPGCQFLGVRVQHFTAPSVVMGNKPRRVMTDRGWGFFPDRRRPAGSGPFPDAGVIKCSPADSAGMKDEDLLLAFREGTKAISLRGDSAEQALAVLERLLQEKRSGPDADVAVVYQHVGAAPRVWDLPVLKPYHPCDDNVIVNAHPQTAPPPIAALLYLYGGRSFAVLDRPGPGPPGPTTDMGIAIGGGWRIHFNGDPSHPWASWTQGPLNVKVLNTRGALTRDQILAMARSTQ